MSKLFSYEQFLQSSKVDSTFLPNRSNLIHTYVNAIKENLLKITSTYDFRAYIEYAISLADLKGKVFIGAGPAEPTARRGKKSQSANAVIDNTNVYWDVNANNAIMNIRLEAIAGNIINLAEFESVTLEIIDDYLIIQATIVVDETVQRIVLSVPTKKPRVL